MKKKETMLDKHSAAIGPMRKAPTVRKMKSEMNTVGSFLEDLTNACKDEEAEVKEKKKRLNYNARDKNEESDALSDSEPSEDNLDEDAMMKIIPKKLGKKKYLKGLEEKKKKLAPPPEKKKDKKPKTELMPCLQSKRKEIEEKRREARENEEKLALAKQATLKKAPSISKPVLHTTRKGIAVRDVAT